MVVFDGQITISMGASAEDKEDITNIEKVVWREVPQPNITPITVMNQVKPVGFHQGHKWIEGEVHVKSEAYDAIHANGTTPVDYLPEGAASVTVPYFVVKVLTTANAGWTATFSNDLLIYSEEHTGGHDEQGITIYKFIAGSVALVADAT